MKKHKLLREDVLPAMASNRKVQRLLNEFMDLLSEYENTTAALNQKIENQLPLPPPPAGDQISPHTAMESVKENQDTAVTDQTEPLAPPKTQDEPMVMDPPSADQKKELVSVHDSGS